jgi:hypothetical protein
MRPVRRPDGVVVVSRIPGGIELMTGKYAEDNEGYCVILTPDECRCLEDTLRRAREDEEEAFARRRLGCFRGSSGSSRRSPS